MLYKTSFIFVHDANSVRLSGEVLCKGKIFSASAFVDAELCCAARGLYSEANYHRCRRAEADQAAAEV